MFYSSDLGKLKLLLALILKNRFLKKTLKSTNITYSPLHETQPFSVIFEAEP